MKGLFLLVCLVSSIVLLNAQGLETFDNFTYTGTAYVDGSFTGNNGVVWNYLHVTGAVAGTNANEIEGNGMILRRSAIPSKIYSDPVPNGIGSFAVQMRKAYTSAGDRQVALYINDTWIADSQIFGSQTGADPTVHLFEVNGINIQGNVSIEIRHIQGGDVNRQLTIDNIAWTAYGAGNTVATPTFTPPAGLYMTPQSVTIACSTPASTIHYTTDGSNPTITSPVFSTPIPVSTNTTIKALAVAAGYTNSNIATANYSFPVEVASITSLRSQPADGTTVYHLTTEAILIFQQAFRFQKFFQDATGGILVDDINSVNTTQYNLYDGVTGLIGKLSVFGGMLQFVPVSSFPAATSSNNTVNPIPITLEELLFEFDDYESRLVKLPNVSFTGTGNFTNGTVYPITAGGMDYNFRTTFYDVDYIGTPLPSSPKDIIGIANSRTDGEYFSARFLADFLDPAGSVASPSFNPPAGVYFTPQSVSVSSATPGVTIHYTIDGSNPTSASPVYSTPINISATTTLKAVAILGVETSGISTAQYIFPVNVNTLSNLRQQPTGSTIYRISTEVFLSFKQTFRNQKFVQDNSAGILIDDFNNIISTNYNVGDGLTGLVGTLSEYGGMLQFIPVADPGTPSSTNNILAIQMLSLSEYLNDFEAYESRLVGIFGVRFQDPQGDFANGQTYTLQEVDGTATTSFRSTFYDVDYIGTPIPLIPMETLIGIPNSRTEGSFLTARSLADLQLAQLYPPMLQIVSSGWPPPPTVYLSWGFGEPRETDRILPWGITGSRIYRDGVMIHEMQVPEGDYTDTVDYGNYFYHVRAVYFGQFESEPSNICEATFVSNEDDHAETPQTKILGNYPNPFNPSTTIEFSLARAGMADLSIFNLKGQRVKQLLDINLPSGYQRISWNGEDQNGDILPSGVYLISLKTADGIRTRKLMLMK